MCSERWPRSMSRLSPASTSCTLANPIPRSERGRSGRHHDVRRGAGDASQRPTMQVIHVEVRDRDDVDRWHRGRRVPPPEVRQRSRQRRIGQEADTGDLHQHRRVPDPRDRDRRAGRVAHRRILRSIAPGCGVVWLPIRERRRTCDSASTLSASRATRGRRRSPRRWPEWRGSWTMSASARSP